MRIQHNIMAMNAYRNYNRNTSALSKNLEKLSSGYKINRAGDDAAGLAISEKMRAQITGLNAAQKNVKDGISLVKTAEGAMQEIQDMLNRMDYLATQSANGTYDDPVDRYNLQKEVDQLRSEINRIADSANFNGIKLLDGSLDNQKLAASSSAISNITTTDYAAQGASPAFKATYVTNRPEAATAVGYAKFDVSLDDIKITANTDGVAANSHTFTLNVGGTTITIDGTTTGKLAGNANASADDIVTQIIKNGKQGTDAAGTAKTAQGDIEKLGTAAGDCVEIDGNIYKMTASANGKGITFTQMNKPADGTVINPNYEVSFSAKPDGTTGKGGKVTGTVNDHVQVTTQGVGIGATHQAQVDVDIDFSKLKDGDKLTVGNKTYVFQIGENSTAPTLGTGEVLVDLHTILKTEADMTDEEKLNKAMVKMTDAMDATGNSNPTWSVGNMGVKGTVGTLSFQSKSTYTDDTNTGAAASGTNSIGGITANGKCDMRTEASVMKQFYSSSKEANASVSFEVDVTKIQKGQQFIINGQKYEFTDAAVADDKDAVAIDLSSLGDIDGNKLLASQTADVMDKIKTAVSAELGATGFDFKVDGNKLTITSKDLANTSKIKENKIAAEVSIPGGTGSGLSLQIGDTSDSFNQLNVSVGDMHTAALKIDGINIGQQKDAQAAIQVIKDAINYVSGVRGDLGATQNRLEHTANNLSVMAENIQDAESTIRDTDVAEEMMAYTKNNILIQSAQAMLAQANAVPQGVLQLLG